MSQADFEIAYDGGALRGHDMDVEQLAPALLAVGDLCREANRVLNGDKAGVSIRVKANFERQCFDIHFQLIQTLYHHVRDFVSDEHTATAKSVLEWLGLLIPGTGLIAYRKAKQGRKVVSETKIINEGGSISYNITFEGDYNSINIPEQVRRLALDKSVSKAEKAVVRPLLLDGIDKLTVRQGASDINTVTKSQASFFGDADVPLKEDFADPMLLRTILELRSPVFVEGEKWQFHFGDQKIAADITDRRFTERVFVYKERFGAGDKIKVDMRITQSQTAGGKIKNAYEITNVVYVWESQDQPPLPFDN